MPSAADREKALETALAQIDRQFGKGSVMRLGSDERAPVEVIPTGSIALDVALGIGGLPRGRIVEIYGPESSGKTTLTLHAIANAQRGGRHRRVHRRRARARPRVRQEARRRHRRPAGLPAGHRRAGARDRRHARAKRLHRPHRDRLRRGPRAARRDRGRDGRLARRPPGPPHVPGAAQAHRRAQPDQHHHDLHQPAAREDRRVLRQPGDHRRRQGAQVLRVGAPRHPPHRDPERRHGGRRQPHAREGRQEQDGAAVQAGRVRHPLRHRHLARGQPDRLRRRARDRAQVRRLVHLRRRPARPGQGELAQLPAREPRPRRRDREEDLQNLVRPGGVCGGQGPEGCPRGGPPQPPRRRRWPKTPRR